MKFGDIFNYPKLLLTMDRLLPRDFSGVRHQHIIDFLLEESHPGSPGV